MNYFEFYGMPVSFLVDQEMVKKKFLELSRKYHPDFFVNEGQEKQEEVLELSTLNTKAFQTLSDFDARMKYILEMKNEIYEGERYELSPGFLMEMMAINEGLMDLREKAAEDKIVAFRLEMADLFTELYSEVKNEIENYEDIPEQEPALKKIKAYYYRKKYLLRIKQSLDTFAARS